ncbi:hypothetical protein [Streptomyces prasinopilosus]|uniref:hypothetical protein n=1 Tax=Streptomyces prasinopilosus TaxID=67344 RepID=UPI0006EB8584|nr:hypothetical protein [Streptomyces prasinopilosus]
MSDRSTPEGPVPGPVPAPGPEPAPPPPSAPPQAPPAFQGFQDPVPVAGRRPGPGRRTLVLAVVVAFVVAFLAGGGVAWWVLGGEDGDVRDHVELSGGELVTDDSDDAYCDDDDIYSYNDCDTDDGKTYEFGYRITNEGDGPANYSVVVNAFNEDGDFVGQTYVGATHLAAGETDSDEGEFNEYSELEKNRELSDIASVKVAHAERVALAN